MKDIINGFFCRIPLLRSVFLNWGIIAVPEISITETEFARVWDAVAEKRRLYWMDKFLQECIDRKITIEELEKEDPRFYNDATRGHWEQTKNTLVQGAWISDGWLYKASRDGDGFRFVKQSSSHLGYQWEADFYFWRAEVWRKIRKFKKRLWTA